MNIENKSCASTQRRAKVENRAAGEAQGQGLRRRGLAGDVDGGYKGVPAWVSARVDNVCEDPVEGCGDYGGAGDGECTAGAVGGCWERLIWDCWRSGK